MKLERCIDKVDGIYPLHLEALLMDDLELVEFKKEAKEKLSEKESFSRDLSLDVNEDATSWDFCWRPCNFNRASK
eukprot:13850372-Ditylum_brightwellii.AAC.1